MLFVMFSSNESIAELRRKFDVVHGRTEESDNHRVAKTINVSLTVASMSGVVVLNVL